MSETPTKGDIRRYLSRTRTAAGAIQRLLKDEQQLLNGGPELEHYFHTKLRAWAEEISGCGSEVQNLLGDRYPKTGINQNDR